MTLGDNPSCSDGPPIGLDWHYDEVGIIPLYEYEQQYHQHNQYSHQNIQHCRGSMSVQSSAPTKYNKETSFQERMHLDAIHRRNLFRRLGFTEDGMYRAVTEVRKIQKRLDRSEQMLRLWKHLGIKGNGLGLDGAMHKMKKIKNETKSMLSFKHF